MVSSSCTHLAVASGCPKVKGRISTLKMGGRGSFLFGALLLGDFKGKPKGKPSFWGGGP